MAPKSKAAETEQDGAGDLAERIAGNAERAAAAREDSGDETAVNVAEPEALIRPDLGDGVYVVTDSGVVMPAIVTGTYDGDRRYELVDVTAFPRGHAPLPRLGLALVARGVDAARIALDSGYAVFWETPEE